MKHLKCLFSFINLIYPFHCEEFLTITYVSVEINRSHVLIIWVEQARHYIPQSRLSCLDTLHIGLTSKLEKIIIWYYTMVLYMGSIELFQKKNFFETPLENFQVLYFTTPGNSRTNLHPQKLHKIVTHLRKILRPKTKISLFLTQNHTSTLYFFDIPGSSIYSPHPLIFVFVFWNSPFRDCQQITFHA